MFSAVFYARKAFRPLQVGRASVRVFSSKFGKNRCLAAMATSSSTPATSPIPGIHRDPTAVYGRPQPCQPPSIFKKNGDSIEFPQIRSLSPPRIHYDEKRVVIEWDNITWSKFHNIWLRDHCRCSECFHAITKQRLAETFDLENIHLQEAKSTDSGLEILWAGRVPHQSIYPWSWLQRNSYDPPFLPKHERRQKFLWGSSIQADPPAVRYSDVMTDELALYKWLRKIECFGFCFVTGVPATPEDTERLALRIGRIRETHYGGLWDFTADLKHGDTAYTNIALSAHTDTTYFTDPCGLQIFHLLSHTRGTGGQTLLVDGFHVASLLSTLEPEYYKILSMIPVPAHSAGASGGSSKTMTYLYHPKPEVGYPIINLESTSGELTHVRYNNADRSVMHHLKPEIVEAWYKAVKTWNKLLTSPDSEYWVQLSPGTAVVVDNHRVLHGRSAFTGERRMCGAYVAQDELISRLNVLEAKFEGLDSDSVWNPAF